MNCILIYLVTLCELRTIWTNDKQCKSFNNNGWKRNWFYSQCLRTKWIESNEKHFFFFQKWQSMDAFSQFTDSADDVKEYRRESNLFIVNALHSAYSIQYTVSLESFQQLWKSKSTKEKWTIQFSQSQSVIVGREKPQFLYILNERSHQNSKMIIAFDLIEFFSEFDTMYWTDICVSREDPV